MIRSLHLCLRPYTGKEACEWQSLLVYHSCKQAAGLACTQADSEPKQLRVATPVNPAPGIGRGCAGIPRAVESCQVIHPPPVPSTPDCAIAGQPRSSASCICSPCLDL